MALNRIAPLNFDCGNSPLNFPSADGVNALSISGAAETITIPSGANIVRLAGNGDFYVKSNGTAAIPGDTTDGTASELIKYQGAETWRQLSGVTSLSVYPASGTVILTATFYTL